MKFFRKGDNVVTPGFGQMEDDFVDRIHKVRLFTFHIEAGFLSGWWPKSDFKWDSRAQSKIMKIGLMVMDPYLLRRSVKKQD